MILPARGFIYTTQYYKSRTGHLILKIPHLPGQDYFNKMPQILI